MNTEFFGCAELREASRNLRSSENNFDAHGRFANLVERLADSSDRFRTNLADGEAWWWHSTYLALDHFGHELDEAEATYLGDLLASAPLRSVAIETLGECPNGLRKCLQKLRPHPLPHGYYHLLVNSLCEPHRAKLLHHVDVITVDLLDVLRILPEESLSPRVLRAIRTRGQAETLLYLIDAICTFLPRHDWDRLWASTRRLSNYRDIKRWFYSWLVEAPFPDPPWCGNEMVRPIRNSKDLLKVGREFQNCLKHYLGDCVSDKTAFYLWTAGDPVVISLGRDPFFGWVVERMEGGSNTRSISSVARADILEQFAIAGFRRKPLFDNLEFAPFTEMF